MAGIPLAFNFSLAPDAACARCWPKMQVRLVAMVRGILLCAGLMALGAGSAVAESRTVLACQYVAASGLDWVGGRWVPQPYTVSEPFALSVKDGRLDSWVVEVVMGVSGFDPPALNCFRDARNEICASALVGSTLFFEYDGMQGAVSYLLGSGSSARVDGARDSLVVMPFVCQAM